MKQKLIYILVVISAISFSACEDLIDSKVDTNLTDEMLETQYSQLAKYGFKAYSNVVNGFNAMDGNLFASVSDEAQYVTSVSNAQRFNDGSWNKYTNPADFYTIGYQGIYDVNFFLENSEDYKERLALNRDTINPDRKRLYYDDVLDIERLRAEAKVLRCYYYFELIKRYGGVPLVTSTFETPGQANLPRKSFDEIVNYIVTEIDVVMDELVPSWAAVSMANKDGRITQSIAKGIKARTLLYAASPLHNPSNNKTKWEKAAKAFYEIIELGSFSLSANYRNLFIGNITSAVGREVIWAIRMGATNELERENFPVATPGGNTGICPSHNLAKAYERKAPLNSASPYEGLDPRFSLNFAYNNALWTGRTLEIWEGGADDPTNRNSSKTGYYLKKFINDDLNLLTDAKKNRNWVIIRYADILLSYAEAMNEAFGPDNNNGYTLTAREALNSVRNRTGVAMPAVTTTIAPDYQTLKERIKHERRVELAFEDHRFWDLLRWKDAETVLNQPITGIRATKNADGTFRYEEFTVAERKFIAPKMYLFPIPEAEIVKSNNVLIQNPGW